MNAGAAITTALWHQKTQDQRLLVAEVGRDRFFDVCYPPRSVYEVVRRFLNRQRVLA